ncbi:Polyprotein [Arachis hypogaea]|nr:Polyprotein [Arachis hypogaea]
MGISWIMTWEYDSAAYEESPSIQYLVRVIKIKWWNKYDINLLRRAAIDQWLTASQKRPATAASSTTKEQIAYKKETQFLAQKRQIMAALAAATSEEDIQSSLQAIQTVPLGEDEEVQSSPAHYYQDSQDPFEM